MPKQEETRNYHFTDADLKQRVDTVIVNINRDIADFNTRGVTTDTLENLGTMNEDFDNMPTDVELLGLITTATENKDAMAEQLRISIRSIRGIANDKYKGKGLYRTFGFEGMDELSDNELYRLSGRVVRVGTNLQSEMAANGLTTDMLTDLKTLSKSFDNAIEEQQTAIENRDLARQARVSAGNILYAEYSRLCDIGKSLYEDTDEAKYNDYVIDAGGGGNGGGEAPPAT